jgi:hypothetical protein
VGWYEGYRGLQTANLWGGGVCAVLAACLRADVVAGCAPS